MNKHTLIEKATDLAVKEIRAGRAYPGTREKARRVVVHLVNGGEYEYWPAVGQIGREALALIENWSLD